MLKYSLLGMYMAHHQVFGLLADGDAAGANDIDTEHAFLEACRVGDEGLVLELLQNGIDPNIVTIPTGHSALYLAVVNGHEGLVRMLIKDFHVNPNGNPARDSRSPLFAAIDNGHAGIVRMMVQEFDFDLDGDDRDPEPPLRLASRLGRQQILGILLDAGVTINQMQQLL